MRVARMSVSASSRLADDVSNRRRLGIVYSCSNITVWALDEAVRHEMYDAIVFPVATSVAFAFVPKWRLLV